MLTSVMIPRKRFSWGAFLFYQPFVSTVNHWGDSGKKKYILNNMVDPTSLASLNTSLASVTLLRKCRPSTSWKRGNATSRQDESTGRHKGQRGVIFISPRRAARSLHSNKRDVDINPRPRPQQFYWIPRTKYTSSTSISYWSVWTTSARNH